MIIQLVYMLYKDETPLWKLNFPTKCFLPGRLVLNVEKNFLSVWLILLKHKGPLTLGRRRIAAFKQ